MKVLGLVSVEWMAQTKPLENRNFMSKPKDVEPVLLDGRLIVPGIEKGSQGKSTLISFIIDWLRLRQPTLKMRVYDPDHLHRTITRMYGVPGGGGEFRADELCHLVMVDLLGKEGFTKLDVVVDEFLSEGTDIALVDGVGMGFEEGFGAWTRSIDFERAQRELSFRVTYLLPVTEHPSTISQAVRTMKTRGTAADYLIVKRQHRDGSKAWWDREGAAEAREIAAQFGARIIIVNEFFDMVAQAISVPEPHDLAALLTSPAPTLYSVANGKGTRKLTYAERSRCGETWVEITKALDSVADVLLPPSIAAKLP